jgi:hypothetical protein
MLKLVTGSVGFELAERVDALYKNWSLKSRGRRRVRLGSTGKHESAITFLKYKR